MYANQTESADLKIADFGLSKMLYGEHTSTVCGTPGYCGKVDRLLFVQPVFFNRCVRIFNQTKSFAWMEVVCMFKLGLCSFYKKHFIDGAIN